MCFLNQWQASAIFFVLFLIPFSIFSQSKVFVGTVSNTNNEPLQNANIIAIALTDNHDSKYAIADYLGRFKLDLEKDVAYEISASYLGYDKVVLKIDSNTELKEYQFKLPQNNRSLDEIVIKFEYQPILVKKDTLIYDVKAFANGTERKMNEILEKLPGIEVSKQGIITVNGKGITKLLVDGKPFFGGGSKLAVENIPADALDKIEVIDDFNEVGFLKDVSDSNDLAMNVKLRKNKKNFIFGDIDVSKGSNKYYLLHTSLFYYKPKSNISFISDFNNIGKQTFSLADLIRFEGASNNTFSNRRPLNSLYSFTNDKIDFVENSSQFTALNFSKDINAKTDIDGYFLFSKSLTVSNSNTQNQYLQNTGIASEDIFRDNKRKFSLGMGNLKLNYSPIYNENWFYNLHYQSSYNDNIDSLNSTINQLTSVFNSLYEADNFQIKQSFEWNKKYNRINTSSFIVDHSYDYATPVKQWLTDTSFLAGLVPLQIDSFYNIQQVKKITNNNLDILFKKYWTLNSSNQITLNVGNSLYTSAILTSEVQLLSNNTLNDFTNKGFGNNIHYTLNDFFVGLDYKFRFGKWINKPGIYYHLYQLNTKQSGNNYHLKKTLFELQWKSQYEFNSAESLEFNYKLSNDFPTANQLADRFTLENYNTVYRGNALLTNEKYHSGTLSYNKINTYRGLLLFANLNYNKKIKTIRNEIEIEGINQFSTPVITDNAEKSIIVNSSISKKIHRLRFELNATLSWFSYFQNLNDVETKNSRDFQKLGFRISTASKKWPVIKTGYSKSFNKFYGIANSKFSSSIIYFDCTVNFLKSFSFKTDFQQTFNDQTFGQSSDYIDSNVSINYQKKNNPFRIEFSVQNYTANSSKIYNSFSDYLISNSTTFTLPRIFLLTVTYKL